MGVPKAASRYPQRIICLTAETTEIAFALGAGDRVVGVSAYAMRPAEARRKPRVSAFTTAKLDRIEELDPDLILSFSDLQADIVRDLVRAGYNVLSLNQRSLSETANSISMLGAVLGQQREAERLVEEFESALAGAEKLASGLRRRPKVYFEEWHDPLIAGIRWVSEIIEVAGGIDIFAELREQHAAGDRIIEPLDVVARSPEIIVASWCGKRVNKNTIRTREGWDQIPAIRHDEVHEIKSPDILAPGPSLLHGLKQVQDIIQAWSGRQA